MPYVRSESAQKMVDAAYTKMIVRYTDGNVRTQWGRNGINNNRIAADPFRIEMLRHFKYVSKKRASIRVATIYRKFPDEVLEHYKNGSWV